ncbi:MAG: RNA methyltransferase [Cryomorphaceae bacterium BACL21 MAG-121220-bin10]|jgi:23S rRNA (guanosine2251-2'-O)-methyltransferase|nr:MAG: RNA methyltransferase [Cryomorphaceae bacterium BACL21 MAG-121220-bin10]|tara:strand:+ start:29662 stop:30399 length:738 start_codon:yes stop_codon:yes gene_type:complete
MKKDQFIFGLYPVLEALQAKAPVDKIFLNQQSEASRFHEILQLAQAQNVTVNSVPQEKLDKLTRSNHQGIVAYLSPIQFTDLDTLVASVLEQSKSPLLLILDQITDARNFGAIIRTAECTGVDGIIILKKGGAPVSADTVKTSAGAIFNIPVCKVDHIKDALYYLQGSGFKVLGASEKTTNSYFDADLTGAMGLVLGSEDKGISKSIIPLLDGLISLPMVGKTKSLNVSVACGALLFEAVRQRGI